jgi:3-oxoacyl-[acyl-carrier protein] reductase
MDQLPVMVITGTSKGIGKGLAEHFLAHDYRVAGCSRGPATIEHAGYHHSQVDVTDEKQVQSWSRQVRTQLGQVDVLVCSVGLVKSALFMAVTSGAVFDEFLKTNIAATFYVCREISKLMLMKRKGRIVNVASIMTRIHEPGTAAYSATKSAVIELTKVMARELAPQGITCNVVSPCMVETDASRALGEEWQKRMLEMQTIKRPATIEEVANVISFFAHPGSGCITGQVVNMALVG